MTGTRIELVVAAVEEAARAVRTVRLRAAEGGPLPSFVPGSHLVIDCGGRANAYSLVGESIAPDEYAISVLRVEDGAGGSAWVHGLEPGDRVAAHLPRSMFPPIAAATRHLLVAGGIGITPVVSHLRAARLWGRDVQVLYAFREGHGAHVDDVKELAGDRCEFFGDRAGFAERLRTVLTEQPLGTHVYVCGPGAMIDSVTEAATEAGWPASRIHSERFGIDALDPGDPFQVVLTETGTTLDVPAGTSLLDAIEGAGVAVPNLCRQGVCGECRIPVSAGTPLHRDLFLSDEEKQACDAIMPCVSRADGPSLEVPL
ncbi:oxidoreductase [Nocardioides sp. GY 10113]|uniref:PDR/VanB family oxidoreductase n=1 Tax=Nocardioides sp. GY 10113 TaxID=2569761 RepID=UPI0010A78649|nr:PDR/VanB family oxidoreductase [Nocardioides sp. GY 10113]TIC87774.1 oxidoreductase [Nocardioides sp. GY 10113]